MPRDDDDNAFFVSTLDSCGTECNSSSTLKTRTYELRSYLNESCNYRGKGIYVYSTLYIREMQVSTFLINSLLCNHFILNCILILRYTITIRFRFVTITK